MEKTFELIVSIVKKGQADKVVKASREAGATGGTIIYGRGTSLFENNGILGIKIQPEKEIILTIVLREEKDSIMKKICENAGLEDGKEGIVFSLPINKLLGTKKFLKREKEKEKEKEKVSGKNSIKTEKV